METDPIENFLVNERDPLDYNDLRFEPQFDLTRNLAIDSTKYISNTEVTIKPNLFIKGLKIILMCLLLCVLIYMLIFSGKLIEYVLISGALLAMIFHLFRIFKSNELNFNISLSREKLNINQREFDWNCIHETLIMRKYNGRHTHRYFVIIETDGTGYKYDLSNFGISDKKLSAIIEHYKEGKRRTI